MKSESFLKLSKMFAFLSAIIVFNLETVKLQPSELPQNLFCQTVTEGKEH